MPSDLVPPNLCYHGSQMLASKNGKNHLLQIQYQFSWYVLNKIGILETFHFFLTLFLSPVSKLLQRLNVVVSSSVDPFGLWINVVSFFVNIFYRICHSSINFLENFQIKSTVFNNFKYNFCLITLVFIVPSFYTFVKIEVSCVSINRPFWTLDKCR